MVKNGHEFVCFFYTCILLPGIVIQNSQLLTSREQGIKHSIQGSELPPIQPQKTQADRFPGGECPYQGPQPCQPLQGHFMKYQLAMQFMLTASTNSERSKIPQSKRENQLAQRMTTVHRQIQANALLGKLVLPRWLPQHLPHKSRTFFWVRLSSTQGCRAAVSQHSKGWWQQGKTPWPVRQPAAKPGLFSDGHRARLNRASTSDNKLKQSQIQT